MATIPLTPLLLPRNLSYRGVSVTQWTTLTTTNADGGWLELPRFTDRSIQVSGVFGAGGSVSIQGTNEPGQTNPVTLTDQAGVALALTTAALKIVLQNSTFIRPFITGGDGTTNLTITLMAKGDDL